MGTLPLRATARDLLVYVAGEEHQDHSVVRKTAVAVGLIKFMCSCGEVYRVSATKETVDSLRNVPEE